MNSVDFTGLVMLSYRYRIAVILLLACSTLLATVPSQAQSADMQDGKLSTRVLTRAEQGETLNLIVEYAADDIESDITAQRAQRRLSVDDRDILEQRRTRYLQRKQEAERDLGRSDVDTVLDYSHLPMALKRFRSAAGLRAYMAHAQVRAIYEDSTLVPVLTESLPLVNQPAVIAGGASAAGATIAILDTGVDYALPAFGSCTAVNTPATCVVNVSSKFGTGASSNSHGTNVAAIALGVASGAKIAALDVFSGTSASSSNVISAINWSISNRSAYNIQAINMSLGDGVKYTSSCNGSFRTPVSNARAAGISVVAAAGNEAFTNGISSPACTPGVISVGAVYDANVGNITWGANLCTDTTTSADKITCFSNSASFLTLLAPGALITAAGITDGGTSQASPHVAGAVTLLRMLYATETLDASLSRLTTNGISITDSRNSVTKPRLNLLASVRPANDDFASRVLITGNSGTTTGSTRFASVQSGEPSHGDNANAQSVWWQWTAPAAGQLSLDTHSSATDTALAVYSGSAVNGLIVLTRNDNDGSSNGASSVLLQTQSGVAYQIAIDGANAAGAVNLNWSLNTTAQVNLSVSISGPQAVSAGDATDYIITASNTGAQTATAVVITYTLPAGASFVAGPAGCVAANTTVVCTLDNLASGATSALTITLSWDSDAHSATHTVVINSDVPDASATNNTATLATVSQPAGSADVPLLPGWALVLLASALMARSDGAARIPARFRR